MTYRGRFAPSPTGALHFGSLIAAVTSFADARAHGGVWLVRIEDLDRPREVPGAAQEMLRTLRAFGLYWDEAPLFQSRRTDAYHAALERLTVRGLTYPCACSRRDIARDGRPGAAGPIYAGTCRHGLPLGRPPRSLRLRTPPGTVGFRDRIQGEQRQDVAGGFGDCILRRADGIHAYQLAVVVDDAWQGISHVVRGADLLDSTPCQCLLQQALGLPTPSYAHTPLAVDAAGHKLSKSQAATPVDPADPWPALRRAWAWLGQAPAPAESLTSLAGFWEYAARAWRIERVPKVTRACVETEAQASIGS
jgi:glutamyl-Q tRNA(Asp) synthetase